MSLPILVTGGTGRLGARVVARLLEAGAPVRVLTHSKAGPGGATLVPGDLTTGAGIDAALAGVGTVVHCAGSAKGDEAMTRTLVAAAERAETRHIVYISVVGADRVPVTGRLDRMAFGYFAAKRAAEQVLEESGVPHSILRATQFLESMLLVARQLAKSPVIPAPTGSRFQPVAVDEVAARLVELALGEPAGLVEEMGGPIAYLTDELVRGYLAAMHRHRLFVPFRMPGKAAAAVRAGAILTPAHATGVKNWEELLAAEAH